jgi:hypothetical protein
MELRFPLDMGVLIITCPNCKTSFRMDPDDPNTYRIGTFDLTPTKKKFPIKLPFITSLTEYIYSSKDIRFLIPLFLFLMLLLNLIKIFQASEEIPKENPEKEKQEFFQETEPENPANPPRENNPSLEI